MLSEKERKILLVRYGLISSSPVILLYAINELFHGRAIHAALAIIMQLSLGGILYFLYKTDLNQILFRLYLIFLSVVILSLVRINIHFGIFFIYMMPLIFFFLQGIKEGLIWYIGLFISFLAVRFIGKDMSGIPVMHSFLSMQFFSYCVMGAIALTFEKSRYKDMLSLKESENFRRDLFESAGDSIMVIDLETHGIIDCNINAYRRLGYPKKEFMNLSIQDFDNSLQSVRKDKDQILMNDEIIYQESYHKRKDGTLMPVEIGAKALDQNGRKVLLAFVRDISDRKKIENEKEEYVRKLQKAFDEINVLQGIIPICSYCKKIRDDQGYWNQVEKYIAEHTDVMFSHGICPDCKKKHFPETEESNSFPPRSPRKAEGEEN
jgi:PAS domain S-box-containing protein